MLDLPQGFGELEAFIISKVFIISFKCIWYPICMIRCKPLTRPAAFILISVYESYYMLLQLETSCTQNYLQCHSVFQNLQISANLLHLKHHSLLFQQYGLHYGMSQLLPSFEGPGRQLFRVFFFNAYVNRHILKHALRCVYRWPPVRNVKHSATCETNCVCLGGRYNSYK